VDLQVRNLAEAQGDISVRGGIFENTGIVIGAVTLFDPQTGHYLAELPLSPALVSRPVVLTGVDNALTGFNSSVATLDHALRRVRDGVLVRAGGGSGAHYHQQAHAGQTWVLPGQDQRMGVDFDLAYSAADGPREFGDHRFLRVNGRLQVVAAAGQADLVVGYQHKFFGWPYLYALRQLHQAAGTSGAETEELDTLLVLANHRLDYGQGGSYLEITAYFRHHQDDYEFDRFQPGLFNPYEHRTMVGALGVQGRHAWGWFGLRYGAQGTWDAIESTALTHGDFNDRGYLKLSLAPELVFSVGRGAELGIRGGLSVDLSTRDTAAFSPLGEVWFRHRWGRHGRARYYLQVAQASQLPGYTALASNPNGGLFRGNKDLRREIARNYEGGLVLGGRLWQLQAAGFFRQDRDLVDWTVVSTFQRTAQNIDLDTAGTELVFSLRPRRGIKLVASHAFLHKLGDHSFLDPPPSFYAFNYAEHRWTLALSLRPWRWISLRADNEFRLQAPNALRDGPQEAVLTTLALTLHPLPGLSVGLAVDNLFQSAFQEVPGVPPALRQVLATLEWRGL
jgi:hypothetical protein